MSSSDIYVRKDVYEADQRAIIAEIQKGNAEVLRVLEQVRSENKLAIEQFRSEFSGKLEQFRSEFSGKLKQFRGEVNTRFDKLEAQVVVLTGRVDGLEKRVDNLGDYAMMGIAFITLLVGLLVFIMPISRFVRRFWKPKPEITIEQIEALIDAKLGLRQ